MNYRKKIVVMLSTFALTAAIINLNRFFTPLGSFMYHFSVAFLIVLIVLFFFKKEIFDTWKNFAIVFVILSIVIVLLAPEVSEGFIEYSKRYLSQKLSGLFLVISVGIIIWKSIQLRKNK